MKQTQDYFIAIVGAGPGGLYAAYELVAQKLDKSKKIVIFDTGAPLETRKCPSSLGKTKQCSNCKVCAIMQGFGGAGAFSDGKYMITNDFGGTLYEHTGKAEAIDLMRYVDQINIELGKDCNLQNTKIYSTAGSEFHKLCTQNKLNLLNADVRHLGTDLNYIVLTNLYNYLVENGVEFRFNTPVQDIQIVDNNYIIYTDTGVTFTAENCIVSVGRSGSKWVFQLCKKLNIPTTSSSVDLGVRVELAAEIFEHLTNKLYESKITYKTAKYEDLVRTFCMNPHGSVVSENTNGVITVNGHSFEDKAKQTKNTNFALLVSKTLTEPFNCSNEYGESIAKLSNMLGGGVIVQRFGDLVRGRRSTNKRITENTVIPTLQATPGDLSLVLPKRILDDIIEMLYALDNVAKGTANDDTLLYGIEVKFYNMKVSVDKNLETKYSGLYIIGDGSGVTHSLAHASASGVYVARHLLNKIT